MTETPSHDAVLYALDCLDETEAAAFEEHLKSCTRCAEELRSYRETASALSALLPAVDPPAAVRQRLLERVAGPLKRRSAGDDRSSSTTQALKIGLPVSGAEGPVLVRADGALLEPTGVDGVSAKALFVDPSSDRITMLVRIEPGATYPAHLHGGPEESFILEGDLYDGEISLRAGDYLRKDPGSSHGTQSSDTGCFMLVVSSLHDEPIFDSPRA